MRVEGTVSKTPIQSFLLFFYFIYPCALHYSLCYLYLSSLLYVAVTFL